MIYTTAAKGSLLSVGLGCSADAFGVRSRLEAECLREFRRIEDVVEFVLVEHLVQFTDSRIKPSREPEHGPREDSILRLRAELLGDEFNELLSGRRISGRRNVACFFSGAFAFPP